jgi:hypothetical protein
VSSPDPFVLLTRVQAWRVLAYLTVLERAVIAGSVDEGDLPLWAQLDEIVIGLEGLDLTIEALQSALGSLPGDDDGDDGGGSGDREPRDPPPGTGPLQLVEIPVPPAEPERTVPTVLSSEGT